MVLPLRYSRVSYERCLDYKQMTKALYYFDKHTGLEKGGDDGL